eukprot:7889159-Pyramimonas_sp.AAC.1
MDHRPHAQRLQTVGHRLEAFDACPLLETFVDYLGPYIVDLRPSALHPGSMTLDPGPLASDPRRKALDLGSWTLRSVPMPLGLGH